MRLEQLALGLQLGAALVELAPDLGDRGVDRALLDRVVRGRPDGDVLEVGLEELAGERVEVLELLDLVAEQGGPVGRLGVGGEDLQRVAPDAERAPPEGRVVPGVLDRDELAQETVAVDLLALAQDLHVGVVGLRRPHAEDARDRGDDHDVAAGEQRGGGRVAQPVDLLVDRRVLLDVEVPAGDVGLGLVVVVVGDEELHGVLGEVGPELVAELGRERLVVGDHQRRALELLHDPRHRHRLAGAGGAEQRGVALAGADALARCPGSPRAGRRWERRRCRDGARARPARVAEARDGRSAVPAGTTAPVRRGRDPPAPPRAAPVRTGCRPRCDRCPRSRR